MEFIEQLKSSVDIVQVIGDYTQLRRIGGGPRYMGLCPFHNEKTASFSVHSQHQFYKCFGCDAHGDVLSFVMEMERFTFWEAVKYLAEKHGIPLPKRSEHSDDETRHRAALHEMHDMAVKMFRETLMGAAGGDARQYLMRRGVTQEVAEAFGLGISDRSGTQLVRAFQRKGFSAEDMEASGLVLKRQDGSGFFDRFRGRLMFPIHSESGQVIAFGGRAMADGDEPKYLNSSETPIYRKSHVLYNLNRARKAMQKQGFTVLVEGYMDVIGVWAAGVENVVATCGTALTGEQIRAMRRHCQTIYLCMDPDAAGARGSEKSLDAIFAEGFSVKVVELFTGQDPDEYARVMGKQRLLQQIAVAPPYFDWIADWARKHKDLRDPDVMSQVLNSILNRLKLVPDPNRRHLAASTVAELLGVDRSVLRDEYRKAVAGKREMRAIVGSYAVPEVELLLLNCLVTSAEIRDEVGPVLRQMNLPSMLKTGRIIDTILKMTAEGETPNFSAVSARLDEADRKLFSCLLEADEILRDEPSLEQALGIVKKLAAGRLQSERDEVKRQIKEAERSGDLGRALELAAQLREMEKKR